MDIKTTTVYGTGFDLIVPESLDPEYKTAPTRAFKGKAAAERNAAKEQAWIEKVGLTDEVEKVEVREHEGYWLMVYVYTDATAAKRKQREERLSALRAPKEA